MKPQDELLYKKSSRQIIDNIGIMANLITSYSNLLLFVSVCIVRISMIYCPSLICFMLTIIVIFNSCAKNPGCESNKAFILAVLCGTDDLYGTSPHLRKINNLFSSEQGCRWTHISTLHSNINRFGERKNILFILRSKTMRVWSACSL